jgi:Spy/CpxP family protein refolding chaperone
MRKLLALAAALAAVLLLTGTAAAQGKKGKFGGGFGGKLFLLTGKDIQKDLKLSDEQITKAKEMSDKQAAERKELFGNIKDKEERRTKFKEMTEAADKFVEELLKPDQLKRLDQLQVQQGGAMALLYNPKISDKLDLSQDQREKIEEIFKEAGPKFKEIFQGFFEASKEEKEAAQQKMADLQKSLLADAIKILNDDQKKTYDGLRGEPFTGKFPQPNFFGMGMGMGGNTSFQIEAMRAPRRPALVALI